MIKVLHVSTHNENCGIGRYQENFLEYMNKIKNVHNEFFQYSPNQLKQMSPTDLKQTLVELTDKMKDFDILHIQHEYSFFFSNELSQLINVAKKLERKVVVTVHTAPDAHCKQPVITGIGVRSTLARIKAKASLAKFTHRYIQPLNNADLVITPNQLTQNNLVKYGVEASIITVLTHPVPDVSVTKASTRIHTELAIQPKDTLLSTVGYISESKGVLDAVKALLFLPKNYKLAIIGGVHPLGNSDSFLNQISDTIIANKLEDRVYITGFIESDDEKNALVLESDICLYPYEKNYYQYVSSAALNDALANHKAVVAYPTESFKETDAGTGAITFTNSFSYMDLSRAIKSIDIKQASARAKKFAIAHNSTAKAKELINLYQSVL